MKKAPLLSGLAFLAVAAFAVVLLANQRGDVLLVQRPAWMATPPAAAVPSMAHAAERTEVDMPEAPVRDMLPPEQIAAALTQRELKTSFRAEVLLDGGMASDVAQGVVRSVENYWKIYEGTKASRKYHALPDFFFAVWPDLGRLIHEGKVTPTIVRIPENSQVQRGMVDEYFHLSDNVATYAINTDAWQVTLEFRDDEKNPFPDLFRLIHKEWKQ